jgi:hypothetical protein
VKAANITIGIASCLWFALALLGRDGLNGVVAQRATGYPNMGQINLYVVWPLFVVIGLLACAWLCNIFPRLRPVLVIASGISLIVILPYCLVWGGGV